MCACPWTRPICCLELKKAEVEFKNATIRIEEAKQSTAKAKEEEEKACQVGSKAKKLLEEKQASFKRKFGEIQTTDSICPANPDK